MNKKEFLSALEKGLSGLPRGEIDERLVFYGEIIDDRLEEGLSEEEAVLGLGPVEEIIARTQEEVPLSRIVGERIKSKGRPSALTVVLLILGAPIWLSLTITGFALVFSLFAALWAVIASLWAVVLSLAAVAVSGIASFGVYLYRGYTLAGVAILGGALFCGGAFIFAVYGCVWAVKGGVLLTKKVIRFIRSLFIGRRAEA